MALCFNPVLISLAPFNQVDRILVTLLEKSGQPKNTLNLFELQKCHSVLPKKYQKVCKFGHNDLKQAQNWWKCQNLDIKNLISYFKSENWHLWGYEMGRVTWSHSLWPRFSHAPPLQKTVTAPFLQILTLLHFSCPSLSLTHCLFHALQTFSSTFMVWFLHNHEMVQIC